MKFAAHGLLCSIPVFMLALAFASSISFADAGPPPPSQVTVHLVSNGTNVTDVGQIVYHCTTGLDPRTNEQIATQLNCSAGTCINEPQYTGSECDYFPAGYFTYDYNGQGMSSETFNATELFPGKFIQQYYEYRLDVQTGMITPIGASNGVPPNSLCPAFFVLAAVLGFVAIKRA
jgi:hypothetical protein